ncbi:peptidase M23 [Micromonospora deserti]|uniref:Peptidase M23 n=1 Tax=Micromonospora deserti TaxID=2070366 RepID=A0A2W2CIS5_9ACTN|nr:M23 family metallopeptidase [Micromonospora deserti]PZF92874.1 peptidase M23 [Micromonospora deserti]
MQEDSFIPNEKTPDAPARHRKLTGGRGRYLIIASVALAGLGLGGVVVAGDDDASVPAATSLDAEARAEAAARADRSARESTAPASPSATPVSPTPSPSTASPVATASPKASIAKPTPKKTSKPAPTWVIPMKGAAITSCYGPRWGTLHAGIDFAMPAGTPVRAAFGGTVEKAGDVGDGYGISVFIDHGNGYLTHYAHLSSTKVSVGDKVSAGETIGLEGSTGDSTGPHLYFEVHQGQMWNQIDPAPFLRARGIDVAC